MMERLCAQLMWSLRTWQIEFNTSETFWWASASSSSSKRKSPNNLAFVVHRREYFDYSGSRVYTNTTTTSAIKVKYCSFAARQPRSARGQKRYASSPQNYTRPDVSFFCGTAYCSGLSVDSVTEPSRHKTFPVSTYGLEPTALAGKMLDLDRLAPAAGLACLPGHCGVRGKRAYRAIPTSAQCTGNSLPERGRAAVQHRRGSIGSKTS